MKNQTSFNDDHISPIIMLGWCFSPMLDGKYMAWELSGDGRMYFCDTFEEALSKIPKETIEESKRIEKLVKNGDMTVDGEDVKIVYKFPVMYCGWECDDEGWIVKRKNGSMAIVMSNHTRRYFATIIELKRKIKEYKKAIECSERALKLIKGS